MSWMQRIIFSLSFLLWTSAFAANDHATFVPSEHVTIGNNIKLYFNASDQGRMDYTFQLPNGLIVSYGDLIALGDFYEIVDQPIAYGKTDAERKSRFLTAFNSVAQSTSAASEANQILAVIHDEKKIIEDALQNGEKVESVYKRMSNENNRKYNCITGGGCSSSAWWVQPGRYLSLAGSNYDHFGQNAWLAYKAGHDLAIEQAVIGYQTHDVKRLALAYAMNAFASHFLSDRFSSGHIRTPREELAAHVTPGDIGSVLSGFMHNEENVNGLHAHNLRGDRWIAYGDSSYFNPKNHMHRNLINETLQTSADQIYSAYRFGLIEENSDEIIHRLLPIADEIGNASRQDISPLFYWDSHSQKLMRRLDTANLYDRHWTSEWWGWSTLALLTEQKGLPTMAQAQIILAGHGEEAMQNGLITDKNMINYIKANSRK